MTRRGQTAVAKKHAAAAAAAAAGISLPAEKQIDKQKGKAKKVPDSSLNPEERERRRVQRELRDIALKLRAEGKAYKPQKYKRKMFLAEGAGKERNEKKKAKAFEKTAVRVVVLPIFWEQKTSEMKQVMGAAEKVVAMLEGLGVRVVIDTNNNFTPGQRMKHWEELGAPVRVEIGPQDVVKGMCVMAIAGEVGTVAKKTKLKMGGQLVMYVRKALEEAGIEMKTTRKDAAPAAGAAPDGAAAAGKGGEEEEEVSSAGGDSDDSDDSDEDAGGEQAGTSGSGAPVLGGDDMDDFELDIDAEENALTMSKREAATKKRKEDKDKAKEKKLKKRSKEVAAGGAGADDDDGAAPGWAEEEAEKKKSTKKAKVVVF